MAIGDLLERVVASLDYGYVRKRIELFLSKTLGSSGKDGYVLGLSGGLDSSVVAALAAEAMHGYGRGKGSVVALIIPHSGITPASDVDDAIRLAGRIGIEHEVIEVGDVHSLLVDRLRGMGRGRGGGGVGVGVGEVGDGDRSRSVKEMVASGNLLARLRMCILYYYANINDRLVLGTSDRSELMLGYYTKYGDGAADLLPIAGLYKVQVRELARHLQIDDAIIRKRSSPMLWKGHYAEQELGMSYEEIDSILYCILDMGMSVNETTSMLGVEEEKVERVMHLLRSSRHKRALPRVCNLKDLDTK
ncbi:MAG: NAD(+) synthase [Candidatus Nitrosocaldus sp.]|nr:NAD(+) synthase [Candidatus Nitrosocaldus sp.]